MGFWDFIPKMLGKVPTERRTHVDLIKEIMESVLDQKDEIGAAFVKVVAEKTRAAGLSTATLQYVFMVLDDKGLWPQMPYARSAALKTGIRFMKRTYQAPDYKQGLQLPHGDEEEAVDQVILEVADWCRINLSNRLATTMGKAVYRRLDEAKSVWKRDQIQVSDPAATLLRLVLRAAETNPEWFSDEVLAYELSVLVRMTM